MFPCEMVEVPAGPFLMGCDRMTAESLLQSYGGYGAERYAREMPQHWVWVSGFYIDVFPITNAQYQMAVEECVVDVPPLWQCSPWNRPNSPVVGVSWFEAKRFAEWRGCDLPTEAEWEKAASWDYTERKKLIYPWGDRWCPSHSLNAESISGLIITDRETWQARFWQSGLGLNKGHVEDVGLREGDASPCGARMLSGHVWEWCLDHYDVQAYQRREAGVRDPVIRSDGYMPPHVLKGGSWVDDSNSCRSTYRIGSRPDAWAYGPSDVGFRCVCRKHAPAPVWKCENGLLI